MTNARNPLLEKLDPAAEATMRSLIGGAIRTQAVYVAAKLGLADHLSLGARSVEDLAQRVHADAGTLKRLLRFLVFNGVFTENDDGHFALNRAAESLQSAHPRSLRLGAIRAGEGLWTIAGRLLSAVQTGRTPHDDVHGVTFFERHDDAEKATGLASRMSSTASGLGEAVAALDSVAQARCVVDVGGAHGALLVRLLSSHAQLRGILFDRASTIESARAIIEGAGLSSRCDLVGGDFFERVPAGGDVYLLSWILHDWDDENALRILRACRAAGGDAATLVIVEVLLPLRARPTDGLDRGVITDPFTLDLQMLLLTGGRERTVDEYRELLRKAGYVMNEVETAASPRGVSILQARVARLPSMDANHHA